MIDHSNNLEVLKGMAVEAARHQKMAEAAEPGTCSYRHHVDQAQGIALIAIASGLVALGAMLKQQMDLMAAIQMIVVHPKEKTNEQPEVRPGE